MTWNRLELHARSRDLDPGLAADIADPLWLLARQWQFGEFQGEDTGTPVGAVLEATVARPAAYRGIAAGTDDRVPFLALPEAPLEAVVESEAVVAGPASLALVAEAGLQLYRMLDREGVPEDVRLVLRKVYPIDARGQVDIDSMEAESRRSLLLITRASFDAARLHRDAGDPPTVPASLGLPPATEAAFLRALTPWTGWYRARFAEFEGERWRPSRMEYAVEVAAQAPDAYLVARTDRYADGRLDWPDFDLRAEEKLPLTSGTLEAPTVVTHELLPQRVRFRGMPVSRFWEFEDGNVYLGDIDAGPTDVVRLLLIEFALIASDDWWMLPLDVPARTLTRIDRLVVSNTFGERLAIRSATEVDGRAAPWRMFVSTGDPAVETGAGRPWLLLVPTLARALEGAPIEEVAFLRDEMANLAWAIERKIEDASGRAEDRHERWLAAREPPPEPPELTSYRLATRVPPHWYPLVPVQAADHRSIWLRRGRLLRSLDEPPEVPKGRILEPEQPLRMHEEEVPRAGMRVTRAWQLARWHDGSTWLWVGRRKAVGRTERASDLRHDLLVEPPRPTTEPGTPPGRARP
jgi:hypothetical protein